MSELKLKMLIFKAREMKEKATVINGDLKKIKEELRTFLIDSGIKKYEGVELRRSFSKFDLELLRLEHSVLFELFCEREKITIPAKITFNNTISKKNLEKLRDKHPELWNDVDYRKEGTARLYGL